MAYAGFKLLEYLSYASNLDELHFPSIHCELPAAERAKMTFSIKLRANILARVSVNIGHY